MAATIIGYLLVGASLLVLASGSENQPLFSGSGHQSGQDLNQKCVIDCDQQSDSECNSMSLEQIAVAMQENSACYNTIEILTTQLTLTGNITFSGLNGLTISGNADLNTTVTCQRESIGLIFNNIAILAIQNLVVMQCGTIPTLHRFAYSSAVTIIHSRNVTAVNLTIGESMGIGLSILGHQEGIVQITSSKFLENKVSTSSVRGGGGVYVGGFEQHPIESITFRFVNCVFQENVAHTEYFDYLFTDDFGEPVDGYGLGGGAAMLFEGNLGDVRTVFSKCMFKRNIAFLGSGLVLKIKEVPNAKTKNNIHITVEHSLFEENGASLVNTTAASAGGLLINLEGTNPNSKHSIVVYNVTFKGNVARFGGGLYFYSDVDSYKSAIKQTNIITIEKSTFDNNTAHTGAAVDITPNVFQQVQTGVLTTPLFRDCIFSNNHIQVNNHQVKNTQATFGIGTIYVSLYDISFQGYNRFENLTIQGQLFT